MTIAKHLCLKTWIKSQNVSVKSLNFLKLLYEKRGSAKKPRDFWGGIQWKYTLVYDGGRVVENPQFSVDVVCGSPLTPCDTSLKGKFIFKVTFEPQKSTK